MNVKLEYLNSKYESYLSYQKSESGILVRALCTSLETSIDTANQQMADIFEMKRKVSEQTRYLHGQVCLFNFSFQIGIFV